MHTVVTACQAALAFTGESAADLLPKQLQQVNKELSSLQPVVEALRILSQQQQEVITLLCAILGHVST